MDLKHWCPACWHTVLLSLSQSLSVTNPPCLCLSISQVHFVNNECNWISLAFEKLTFTSQPSFPEEFLHPGILAAILFASTASTILGILPRNCCSPFLHPQWIPSTGQRHEIAEWPSFPKQGFSYQHSDVYFHWGRVQNRGAKVFQGEPVLDNLCFYASKCNKMRRKKIPN